VVVFDLGRVLLDFDYLALAHRFLPWCAAPSSDVIRWINQSTLLQRFESGELTTLDFCQQLMAATGFRGSLEQFRELFGDIFTPIPAMVQLNADLRARGIPTFIFSNTNDLAVECIRRQYPFFADFDGYIFSYEHHALKPRPALYEQVEVQTGRQGEEMFFLDDRLENIAAGAARGWQAVLHETPEKSRAAAQAAGLLSVA